LIRANPERILTAIHAVDVHLVERRSASSCNNPLDRAKDFLSSCVYPNDVADSKAECNFHRLPLYGLLLYPGLPSVDHDSPDTGHSYEVRHKDPVEIIH
jgi:hypothetical protein